MKSLAYYKQKAAQAAGLGHLQEAEIWLQKARELSASDTDVWQLSVQVNGQLGELKTATICCEQLLSLNPDNGTAWSFLGTTKLAAGHHQEALEAFDRALHLSPNTPMMLINRGCALYLLNKIKESIDSFRKAIKLDPSNANAYFNLARACKSQGKIGDAIKELKTALKLSPDLVEAHTSLGTLLYENGSLIECERVWKNAISTDSNHIQYRLGLAKLYTVTGEYDHALEQYKIIRQLEPNNALALCGEADVLEKKGDFYKAYSTIKLLLAADTKDVLLADVFSRLCHHFDACEEAINYLTELLESNNVDEYLRDLHFSLGYVFDRIGRYDAAFSQFEKANQLCNHHCDMGEIRQRFSKLRRYFSRESIDRLPRSTTLSEKPVFIVGMPRSGTTLVEQIIASHQDAFGAGELPDVKLMINSMPSLCGAEALTFPECMQYMDSEKMNKMAVAYLNRLDQGNNNCTRVIDKMPHNFLNIGLLCLLFPKARIIHCMREPADTCLSIYSKSFINLHAYGTNLRTLGQYYQEYLKLMEHWRDVFPERIFEIKYEDLVSDQEYYSRALLKYCGLDWDDQCLEFYNSKRTVVTASYDQVRRPIYNTSVEKWRKYEKFIQPLLKELKPKHQ